METTRKFSSEQVNRYLEDSTKCVECGEEGLEELVNPTTMVDGNKVFVKATTICRNCGCVWFDIFKLHDAEFVRQEDVDGEDEYEDEEAD